jgi:hypothetical protein
MTLRNWGILLAVYALFFSWYTSFGGPLSGEEIDGYLKVLREVGAEEQRLAVWQQFMESDTGDDFAMFNAIELREVPLAVAGAELGESSAAVLAKYTQPFLSSALWSAAHPVMAGSAAAHAIDIWGIEGAERWTMGALVRYRSRRDLMRQVVDTAGLEIHDFKIAAMEKTVAYPLDPWWHLGDLRLLLALVLMIIGLALQARRAGSRQ